MTVVTDATAADESGWRALWSAYVAFYEAQVPEAATAATWARALDPQAPLMIRLAREGDAVVGFTVSVLHLGTWTENPICYLEDLFVDPDHRGAGAGRALIQDLLDLGAARRWAKVYWHTRADNGPARALYNRFAAADGFVRYRISIPSEP